MIREWIGRSKGVPLQIIRDSTRWNFSPAQQAEGRLKLVLDSYHRVESLFLVLPDRYWADTFWVVDESTQVRLRDERR